MTSLPSVVARDYISSLRLGIHMLVSRSQTNLRASRLSMCPIISAVHMYDLISLGKDHAWISHDIAEPNMLRQKSIPITQKFTLIRPCAKEGMATQAYERRHNRKSACMHDRV